MALLGASFLADQNVEELLKQVRYRWLNTVEICKIFQNHQRLHILASQRQEKPPIGSFFAIKKHRFREFKRDGHNWCKKKNGRTIQESHEYLKVDGVKTLNCLYAYGENNANFQRRIYRMIQKELVDIVLFHYREDKGIRENCKRNKNTSKVTIQSSLKARKAPVLAITGFQGSSSSIASYGCNQLLLPSQTTDTSNINNVQGNVESAGAFMFSGTQVHSSNQLLLPLISADTCTQNNIQCIFPELPQSGMQITDAGFFDTYCSISFTGDDVQDYNNDFENQPFPQVTGNDLLPNLGTPGSPSELPQLVKSMEQFSEVRHDETKL